MSSDLGGGQGVDMPKQGGKSNQVDPLVFAARLSSFQFFSRSKVHGRPAVRPNMGVRDKGVSKGRSVS